MYQTKIVFPKAFKVLLTCLALHLFALGHAQEKVTTRYDNGQVKTKGEMTGDLRTGTWMRYAYDGQILEETNWHNGVQHGKFTFYHPNGKVAKKGEYNNGLPEGEWVAFHPNGKKARKENWQNGVLHGPISLTDSLGNPGATGNYHYGKKDGAWSYYSAWNQLERYVEYDQGVLHGKFQRYVHGRLQSDEYYVQGVEDGQWLYYDQRGKVVREVNYKKGKRNGAELWLQNEVVTQEQYWIDDKKDGRWVWYSRGKPYKVIEYKLDVLHGKSQEYYHGMDVMMYDYTYFDGERHGHWRSFNTVGKVLTDMHYEHGRLVGEYAVYCPQGYLKIKGTYAAGVKEGTFSEYYCETGVLHERSGYKNNLRSGEYQRYHPNKKIQTIGTYLDGKKIETWKYYDTDGQLIKTEYWKNGRLEKMVFET